MLGLGPLGFRITSWLHRRDVTAWYDPRYRLPFASIEVAVGLEPRRADFAVWWLRDCGALPEKPLRRPHRISYENLSRVHTPELLESLGRPEELARVFSVDPSDVPVARAVGAPRASARGCGAGGLTKGGCTVSTC